MGEPTSLPVPGSASEVAEALLFAVLCSEMVKPGLRSHSGNHSYHSRHDSCEDQGGNGPRLDWPGAREPCGIQPDAETTDHKLDFIGNFDGRPFKNSKLHVDR